MTYGMETIVRPFQQPVQGRFPVRPLPVQPEDEAILEWGAKMGAADVQPSRNVSYSARLLSCADLEGSSLANFLHSEMQSISAPYSGCKDDPEPYIEETRETSEHRVENPEDSSQFVDVERVEKIKFKLPKTLQKILGAKEVEYKLKHGDGGS